MEFFFFSPSGNGEGEAEGGKFALENFSQQLRNNKLRV